MRQFIKHGDTLERGGEVLEPPSHVTAAGRRMARLGDPVICAEHGLQTIAEGDPRILWRGAPAAREDDRATCGCRLKPRGWGVQLAGPGELPDWIHSCGSEVDAYGFRLIEIPDTMEKLGWLRAAAALRRWHAGAPFTMTQQQREGMERVPPSQIVTDIITMDWALGFERVQQAFSALMARLVTSKSTEVILRKVVRKLGYGYREAGGQTGVEIDFQNGGQIDIDEFHRTAQFQFWRVPVDIVGLASGSVEIDEFLATVGGFTLYAAASRAIVDFASDETTIRIPEISVYIRDTFDFYDTQYLGHWNRDRVQVRPLSGGGLSFDGFIGLVVCPPAATDWKPMYPATNHRYHEWRDRFGKGGDYLSYTDTLQVTRNDVLVKIPESRYRAEVDIIRTKKNEQIQKTHTCVI